MKIFIFSSMLLPSFIPFQLIALSISPRTLLSFSTSSYIRRMKRKDFAAFSTIVSSRDNSNEVPSSDIMYPNWRTQVRGYVSLPDHGTPSSPFAHKTKDSSTAYCNAPWSDAIYQSSLHLYDSLISCKDSYISPSIHQALSSLNDAYRLYGPESVVGSFNGGKDAVVVLELMRAAHAHYYRMHREELVRIRPRIIYFNDPHEFPQVLDFVSSTVLTYDLDMLAFDEGISFKDGLDILVRQNFPTSVTFGDALSISHRPYPMAFVLGTRSGDPNAATQGIFAPSSSYMSPFMRVNPILDWSYGHVWHLLRTFKIPYCVLYDQGYTSLGNVLDTTPCPALRKIPCTSGDQQSDRDDANDGGYFPAYMLTDWSLERAGRLMVKKDRDSKKKNVDKRSIHTSMTIDSNNIPVKAANEDLMGAEISITDDDSCMSIRRDLKTVGLIIIGDEILKGLTPDTNTHVAAIALRAHNVPLSRVMFVPDKRDDIISVLQALEEEVDVVITSGGVGPTHDDITIKSVCDFLGSEMVLHKAMADVLLEKMNTGQNTLTEAQIKMATLPSCAQLRYLSKKKDDWPILQCRNIFVLPGVPQFFKSKVEILADYLGSEEAYCTFKVILSIDEASIVPILNTVVENHPLVNFGSYPFVNHPDLKTVVTLEGKVSTVSNIQDVYYDDTTNRVGEMNRDAAFSSEQVERHVRLALSDLVNRLPSGSVLRVENNDHLVF